MGKEKVRWETGVGVCPLGITFPRMSLSTPELLLISFAQLFFHVCQKSAEYLAQWLTVLGATIT